MRLDVYLVQQQFFPSREKAKQAIAEGTVLVNQQPAAKAGMEIHATDHIEVTAHELLKYVSAGGWKLEKAIHDFHFDFSNKTVLDIGASTGGFTDCALQHGASLVYAVDVGSNQLHPSLQQHPRIISLEQTNIKDFPLPQLVDVVVMDVSFTSQVPVLALIPSFLKEEGVLISLIKPQFELDQKIKFTNGIVTNEKLRQQAVEKVIAAAASCGLHLQQLTTAPLHEKKNVEYLGMFVKR
ncbi:MAG TPA: TlyA family RNA methyltransferase [Lacibacter sp.]|nr:TlyA family RNA methyltransferase [Lacibacter sp.]